MRSLKERAKAFLGLGSKKPEVCKRGMPREDRALIRRYAAGSTGLKDQAIAAYRREVIESGSARGTPEKNFMAEVDNYHPDLMIRRRYRNVLLGKE